MKPIEMAQKEAKLFESVACALRLLMPMRQGKTEPQMAIAGLKEAIRIFEESEPPAPSRDEELLALIEKFARIARWDFRRGTSPREETEAIQRRHLGAGFWLGPEWATSDEAAEEAAAVAVSKWGGLWIRHDIGGQWTAMIPSESVVINSLDTAIFHGIERAETRGEAALKAIVSAAAKDKQ